jgi:MarR family transcriptional regulator, organic hydroperoxide resistance regulator
LVRPQTIIVDNIDSGEDVYLMADGQSAMAARSELPAVLQFMQLLWAIAHGLETTSKRMNLVIGITGPQRLVLRVVGLFPGISAKELASILHIHPSTLTGILKRLVAQRLLVRVEAERDRRRAVLRLSAEGRRVNRRAGGTVEAAVSRALRAVPSRERQVTRRVLERLSRQLFMQ